MTDDTPTDQSTTNLALKEKISKKKALYNGIGKEITEFSEKTISIENLYSQLQSLQHEIDIETIQKKMKRFDSLFKLLEEDEDIILEMINWYKENIRKT
jgi:biotin-(acetyl-CoA carboxylase) ligase